jgi:hypothetical protein
MIFDHHAPKIAMIPLHFDPAHSVLTEYVVRHVGDLTALTIGETAKDRTLTTTCAAQRFRWLERSSIQSVAASACCDIEFSCQEEPGPQDMNEALS